MNSVVAIGNITTPSELTDTFLSPKGQVAAGVVEDESDEPPTPDEEELKFSFRVENIPTEAPATRRSAESEEQGFDWEDTPSIGS